MPEQIDPFAAPTLPSPTWTTESLDKDSTPPVPNLADAPEVGITAAQTAPGSRQRRSERDKAQAELDKANRRVTRLEKSAGEAKAAAERYDVELQAARANVRFLAGHPALADGDA